MTKYLLLAAFAWLAWSLWRKPRKRGSDARQVAERGVEQMVVCAHCGVHQPLSESLQVGEHYYCCAAHRRDAEAGGR